MEQFYADCYERFTDLHKEIKSAIEGLSTEALDWVPAGNANSITVLITHLTAAEKFWAADIATGQTSDRVRAEEFEAAKLTEGQLVSMLDETLQSLQEAFERLSLADLHTMRQSTQHDMTVTSGWAILHALEHAAQHVGHIQLTVQLWEE
ncbi:MAG: DinB family protein [Anaerolineales bacterium]|nr:DinB family protein [Anaerolineales bacterium]